MSFTFMQNPDILENIAKSEKRPPLVIGFAAETENLSENAAEKRNRKGCDWMVANLVKDGAVFGADTNKITFIAENGEEQWPSMTKIQVAEKLAEKIIATLNPNQGIKK